MSNDAQQEFKGREKARFPLLLLVGIVLAVAVVIAAFAADSEYGIPVVILLAICIAAAVGYRVLAGSTRSDADSSDNVPKQAARSERPLGDTPEAHDEISPHDLPLDNPGRFEAQRESGEGDAATDQGTTRGTSGDSVAH